MILKEQSSQEDGERAQNGAPKQPDSSHSVSDLDEMSQPLVKQLPYM